MSTYHDPRAVNAYATLSARFQGVLLGWIAYRSGKNYYDLGHDLEESIIHGATALRRWWIWIAGFKLWLIWVGMTGWMSYLRFGSKDGHGFMDITGDLPVVTLTSYIGVPITFVFALAVPYTRNIDYSMFKRRLLYKVAAPLAHRLDRIPVFFLYIIPIVLYFTCINVFDAMGMQEPFDESNYQEPVTHTHRFVNVATRDDVCPALEAGATLQDLAPLNQHWPSFNLQQWVADHCPDQG